MVGDSDLYNHGAKTYLSLVSLEPIVEKYVGKSFRKKTILKNDVGKNDFEQIKKKTVWQNDLERRSW